MSDDVEPPPDGKVKTKKKRKLKRANTTPAKQKAPSDGITLARLEHNAFSSQLHMLDDDKVDPSQSEYDTAVQRKLARLRLKNRGQRQSAPTSPKAKTRPEKKTFASSARTSFSRQPIPPTEPTQPTQPIHPSDDMFDTSGFDDPFFNTPTMAQQPRPPPPRQQTSVPIAEEVHTTQFVSLAPAATTTVTPSTTATTTTTRAVRSHTLPTLPMSATSLANDPLAPIEKDQSTKFATSDDHMAFSATTDTKPKLKDQDSTDLSDFFQMSMSAPTSRRQSKETPFQPYFHPAGADAAGRRSVVHVPVYVPMYNVAGGVPYQQPHMYSAPQAVQQPIQQPAPGYGYPQPTGNPYANYPMTPPARMPSHRGW